MRDKTHKLVLTSIFAAIIIALALTPFGIIRLPIVNATTIHIPVILGSLILGPKIGAGLGFMFGLTSLFVNSTTPGLISFVFSPLIPVIGTDSGSPLALIVCFVPRILVGVVPWFVYKGLSMFLNDKFDPVKLVIAGVLGSMTNTLLVLHFIFIFFRNSFAQAQGIEFDVVYGFIMGIVASSGIPEAVVAGIIVVAVYIPVMVVYKKTSRVPVS